MTFRRSRMRLRSEGRWVDEAEKGLGGDEVTTFKKVETRTQCIVSVEDALPVPRQGYAGDYIPTKIIFTVGNYGTFEEALRSTKIIGHTVSKKGVKGREMTMGHYWPLDWTKTLPVLQEGIRASGLAHLTSLPL